MRWSGMESVVLSIVFGFICCDNVGPRFVQLPAEQNDYSNERGVVLSCPVSGKPEPVIMWKTSDLLPVTTIEGLRRIEPDSTLIISPFPANAFRPDVHVTSYKCEATNSLGKIVSTDIAIRAVLTNDISVSVSDVTVLSNSSALLKCRGKNIPLEQLAVTAWTRVSTQMAILPTMEAEGDYHALPSGELIVYRSDEDSNGYTCSMEHTITKRTSTSLPAVIKTVVPGGAISPTIQEVNTVFRFRSGEPAVIPCIAQGHPGPQIRWSKLVRHQAVALPPTRVTRSSLFFYPIVPENAGVYRCEAVNSVGQSQRDFRIEVFEPPIVSIRPETAIVDLGGSFELQCFTTSTVLQYTWYLNGGRAPSKSVVKGDKLMVSDMSQEDAGMYQCLARCETGAAQAIGEIRLGDAAPIFRQTFVDQTIIPGPFLSLICEAWSLPISRISWTLDGFPVVQTDRTLIGNSISSSGSLIGYLNITSVNVEDGGRYSCIFENRKGKIQNSKRINVYGLPYVRPVGRMVVPAGVSFVVTCPVSGYPLSDIMWQIDGSIVKSNPNFTVYTNGSLLLRNANSESHSKNYRCLATDHQGNIAQGDIPVQVLTSPKISPFLFEIYHREGDRVAATCSVSSGDPPISVVWEKDNQPILTQADGPNVRHLDSFTSILTISSARWMDSGEYSCVAKNSVAEVRLSQRLIVQAKPRIEPFSFQDNLSPGMRTRGLCGISMGTPPFSIYWLKDSLPVASTATQRVEVKLLDEFTNVLTISDLSMADAGFYECVARNEFFEVRHGSRLSLKVAPFWKREPVNTTVTVGQPIYVPCDAGGFPEPAVSWHRLIGSDEFESQPLPKYRVSAGGFQLPNGTLLIMSASKYDEGKYECKAMNGVKNPLIKQIYLFVTSSPRFLPSPSKFSVRSKEPVALLCEVQGSAPVEITWQKSGMKVVQNQRISISTATKKSIVSSRLEILNVYPEDVGIFVCIASNHYGWSHLEITLSIQEPPPAPEAVRATLIESRQANIVWKVSSADASQVAKNLVFYLQYKQEQDTQWSEIKLPRLPVDRKFEYILQNLTPASVFKIRLFSETQGGRSQASDVETLRTRGEAPSGAPHDVRLVVTGPTEVKVAWIGIPASGWNSDRIGYTLEGKSEQGGNQQVSISVPPTSDSSPEHEITVGHLVPFSRYAFTVIGLNQYGMSARSRPVTATTLEDVPSVFPRNIQCVVLSSSSIRVIWDQAEPIGLNGLMEGYKTYYEPENGDVEAWKNEIKLSATAPVVLTGLEPATTYKIRVAISNKVGVGPLSPQVLATTHEEGPSAPGDVKVIVASTSRVTVCWSAPTKPNGVISQYSVYYRSAVTSVQPTKEIVPGSVFEHEISSLVSQHPYEFWVRASTKAGSGESSRVVRQIIYTKDGQGICSWGKTIQAFEGSEVELPCKAVCSTSCRWYWNFNKRNVTASERFSVHDREFLKIKNVRLSDAGNYSCVLKSHLGLESIKYTVIVHELPAIQYIDALSVERGSVALKWDPKSPAGRRIRQYIIHHREEGGEWQEKEVDGAVNSYEYNNLSCGRSYQFNVVAVAGNTAGPASSIASVKIRGKLPSPAPPSQSLIDRINSTYIVLNLSQWPSGGCPISGFDVEYKMERGAWKDYWRNSMPLQRLYIYDLQPATSYVVRITATNPAGSLSHEYNFVTLGEDGSNPSQSQIRKGFQDIQLEEFPGERGQASQFDLPFWLLVSSSILGTLSLMGLALVCHLFRKHTIAQSESTTIALDSIRSYSGTLMKQTKDTDRQCDSVSERQYSQIGDKVEEDHYEEVRPYATFELQRGSPRGHEREDFAKREKPLEIFYEPKRLYRRPPPIDGDSDYESFPYGTHSRPPPSYHTGTVVSRTESAELLDFETYDRRHADNTSTFYSDGTAKLRQKVVAQLPADVHRFKPAMGVKVLY